MTPFYLNALFVLLVARFALAAAPNGRRQSIVDLAKESVNTSLTISDSCDNHSNADQRMYWFNHSLFNCDEHRYHYFDVDGLGHHYLDLHGLLHGYCDGDGYIYFDGDGYNDGYNYIDREHHHNYDGDTNHHVDQYEYGNTNHDANQHNISARTLSAVQMGGITDNSVANCQATCLKAGYDYAGVEFSRQCFCGSSIRAGVTLGGTCDSACSGGVGTCGGTDAIDIYKAVTAPAKQILGITNNSVASCQASCLDAGYRYAGVEDFRQCFCDSSIRAGIKPASLTNCQDACTSGVGACGGTDYIAIYEAA
ncbi:hypothetical protein C8J57DRAFT_1260392 [Mycena rebaudengoi]|nr:hypothetical protein C8J57DRAFT_1260392 [Mycena rebaudengoi]